MVQAFESYIKTIAMLLVFSGFVMMIAPNNSLKKFISLILGLMVVGALIQPFAVIRGETGGGKNRLWTRYNEGRQQILYGNNRYEEEQMALILEVYKRDLEAKTIALLEERFPETKGDITEIMFTICEDSGDERFGMMEAVRLTRLSENGEDGSSGLSGVLFGNTDNSAAGQEEELDESIKNVLSDFYNLSSDNIYITVQKKKEVSYDG